MILLELYKDETSLFLLGAREGFKSYGTYQIEIELEYRGEKRTFKTLTNDMQLIDEAKEIEDSDEKAEYLYKGVKSSIDSAIGEWIMDVDDEN